MATITEKAPYRTFSQCVRECEDFVARALARLADKHGMSPAGMASHSHLLMEGGIDPQDISPATIHHADLIFRTHSEEQRRFERDWNEKFCPDNKEYYEDRPEDKPEGKRKKLFGHPVTAVIRWMGKEGWTFQRAQNALDRLGYGEVAEATIRAQLSAGAKGQRGDPADLTLEQRNTLITAAE